MKNWMFTMAVAAMLPCADGVQAQTGASQNPKKVLVAYFSHSGNTRTVARQIARLTGGELFEIVPATAYPTDYRAVVEQAEREIEAGVRPALKNQPPDVAQYDVVFVGSPCWWSTVAPPVATFLAACDLRGKTVVPFMTHEGSGMGRSEADVRRLCPGAEVAKGLPVRGGAVDRSEAEVERWLRASKLAR